VAASPALRADVERLAYQLEDWARRYQSREWRPALAELRAARGEVEATFVRLTTLSDPAELLSVAAPLGATGFRWVANLDDLIESPAFSGLALALSRAAVSCGAPEPVRASCDFVLGEAIYFGSQFSRARPLLERALEARSRLLGPADVDTLCAQHALGACVHQMGAYAEAQPLIRAAYEGRKRLLGPNDPATLLSLQLFGGSLITLGKAAAGEALLGVAVRGLEEALGPDNPHTLYAVTTLGLRCKDRGDVSQAEALLRRVVEGTVAGLGEESSALGLYRSELGRLLLHTRRPAEAESFLRQAVEGLSRIRGAAADPTMLQLRSDISVCLYDQGRHAEALALQQQLLATATAALGANHETTICMAMFTARTLAALGRHQEALALAQPTLPRAQATLGPDDPDTRALSTLISKLQAGANAPAHGRGRGRRR
jgi:tetratricopeptide (TPR) repeat protein